MRERDARDESEIDLERRDVPLSDIWDAVTKELGHFFTLDGAASTSLSDVSSAATSTQATTISPTGEMTITSAGIPISTVTVEETSFQTTFVTVELTTDISPTYAPVSTAEAPSITETTSSCTSSSSTSSSSSSTTSDSSSGIAAGPLPTLVTSSTRPPTTTETAASNTQESASSPSTTAAATISNGNPQKQAIIGGLSGSIAGLFLIGLLACLWWRRRKPRFEEDDTDSLSEKGLRPILARKWSELTHHSRGLHPPPPAVSRGSTPEPEPDGQILRVSLDNWARPYAHDQGFRESQGPTTLRVTNPDLSRPTTPLRPSIETAGSFLKRQRNALAAALYGRPSSRAESPQRNLQVPGSGNTDPALSTEFLAPKAIAPSVRSGSTNASVPVIVQQPPEDPFLTPPDESAEDRGSYPMTPPHTQPSARPGITPLQNQNVTPASTMRTMSNLGSSLNPFRTKSNASSSLRSVSVSRHSNSTFSSAGDPFMLDRPSLHSYTARSNLDFGRGKNGGIVMYEGT